MNALAALAINLQRQNLGLGQQIEQVRRFAARCGAGIQNVCVGGHHRGRGRTRLRRSAQQQRSGPLRGPVLHGEPALLKTGQGVNGHGLGQLHPLQPKRLGRDTRLGERGQVLRLAYFL